MQGERLAVLVPPSQLVERIDPGRVAVVPRDVEAPGSVVRGVVVPPLPYRMRLEVVLDDCVRERCIDASVHGDLEGVARIAFEGDDTETRVHAAWTIEMMQPSMRVAARIAPRLLRWGHDRVVDATVQGLDLRLGDELV